MWPADVGERTIQGLLAVLFTALQQHLDAPLFASDANPWCADWRASFEADQFGDEVQYMLGGGSRSIAPSDAELDALCNSGGSEDDQSLPADAFERLAYTLAARVGCAPEVAQGGSWLQRPARDSRLRGSVLP